MDSEVISNNLTFACKDQNLQQLRFTLFQVCMRGWISRGFVSQALVENALNLALAQEFLRAGVDVDCVYKQATPLAVALLSGCTDHVIFYLKAGAAPNKSIAGVDTWFYACHTFVQSTMKMRELLLAGATANHVVWWNDAWFLPWTFTQYSSVFRKGANTEALSWLSKNNTKSALDLLVQDELYSRTLDYIVTSPVVQLKGGAQNNKLFTRQITRALEHVPKGSDTEKLLLDTLQPFSKATAHTFSRVYNRVVKQVEELALIPSDVVGLVFAYCDRYSFCEVVP